MVDKVSFSSLGINQEEFNEKTRRQYEDEVLALLKYRTIDNWTEKAFISLLFEINLLRSKNQKNSD